ncbi:MBL fold metallo-hydrolase [Myxococcota bacterium]|nr:MBL fold metallo-hydrolase [Myxococcota bacterium]MBU1534621.1 MBL fold metallo-hydrolase [Myxococcota bacterium]
MNTLCNHVLRHPAPLLFTALLWLVSCTASTSNNPGTDSGTDGQSDHITIDGGLDITDSAADITDATGDGDVTDDATLTIEQLPLRGTGTGESILIVGPDGTRILMDTGNDSHGDEILDILDARFGERIIEWVILTHYHSDHIGAFDNLFVPGSSNGNNPVIVTRGFIIRGLYDVGTDMLGGDFQEMCEALTSSQLSGMVYSLCTGDFAAPCSASDGHDPWPSSGCPGLLWGNMEDPSDDDSGAVTWIPLGSGARLYFFNGNAHIALSGEVHSAETEGITVGYGDVDPENARSLGGIIRWGNFSYLFNGDLTGAGDDESPPIEGFYAGYADLLLEYPGGPGLIPAGSVDTAHISHHGYTSSTSEAWVDWILPPDSATRNGLLGSNMYYYRSPTNTVMDRLAPRLGDGYVWTPQKGTLSSGNDKLRVVGASVMVQVTHGGAQYQIFGYDGLNATLTESYTSTIP